MVFRFKVSNEDWLSVMDNLFSYPANRFSFFPCFPLPRLCEADGSFHSLAFPRRSLHL